MTSVPVLVSVKSRLVTDLIKLLVLATDKMNLKFQKLSFVFVSVITPTLEIHFTISAFERKTLKWYYMLYESKNYTCELHEPGGERGLKLSSSTRTKNKKKLSPHVLKHYKKALSQSNITSPTSLHRTGVE